MKKIYIFPEIITVELKGRNAILSGSNPQGFSETLDEDNKVDGGDILSRDFGFGDEEE